MPSPRPLVHLVRTRRAPHTRTGPRQSLVYRASALNRYPPKSPNNVIDLPLPNFPNFNLNLGRGKTKRKRRKTYKRRKSKRKSTKKRK